MKKTENAGRWFDNTYNCSQAVLASFAADYGLSEDLSLRLGCAFGGGIARRQLTCGAVTGALMAIGLAFGRAADDPYDRSTLTYEKSNEFMDEFARRNGSVGCKDLLGGHDMNLPEGQKKIRELNLFQTACSKYVRDAVEIAEGIIARINPGVPSL